MRDGNRIGMSNGDKTSPNLECGSEAGRTPVEPQLRRTARPDHFHVLPQDTARMAGPERLHGGFLYSEAAGQVRNGIAVSRTIGNLPFREDPAQKACPVPFQRLRDSREIRCVEADSNHVHI